MYCMWLFVELCCGRKHYTEVVVKRVDVQQWGDRRKGSYSMLGCPSVRGSCSRREEVESMVDTGSTFLTCV